MKKIIYISVLAFLFSCSVVDNVSKREEITENPTLKIKINALNKRYRGSVYNQDGININELPLEQYLYSVVGSEMPKSFDIEALKAQAIAARTYAIVHKNNLYDDQRSQVYNGITSESEKVKRAVNETYGMILTYNDKPIDALYTSSCGSHTLDAKDYFGKDVPYLKSVEDFSKDKTWNREYTLEDFNDKLESNTTTIEKVDNLIYLDDKVFTAKELKLKLGLRSPIYTIELVDGKVQILGEGYGHCVGMSQFGANNLAKMGYNYEQILKHYYTGVEIKRIY